MFGQPQVQLPVCPTLDKIMHYCPCFTDEEMHWDRDLSSHRGAEVAHQGMSWGPRLLRDTVTQPHSSS